MSRKEVDEVLGREAARLGRDPSLRELRRALGGRGSMTTLARHRSALLGERLLAGHAAEAGSAAAALAGAVSAAYALLGAEAAEAADEAIARHVVDSDARVAAATERAVRAQAGEADVALERERALGQLETLGGRLAEWQHRAERAETALESARGQLDAAARSRAALEASLAEREVRESALMREHQDTASRLAALERELVVERDGRRKDADEAIRATGRLAAELDRARATGAEAAALAEATAQRLEATVAAEREKVDALGGELAEARARSTREAQRADESTRELRELSARCAGLDVSVREERARSARLDDEIAVLRRREPELERLGALLGAVQAQLGKTSATSSE